MLYQPSVDLNIRFWLMTLALVTAAWRTCAPCIDKVFIDALDYTASNGVAPHIIGMTRAVHMTCERRLYR